MRKSTLAVASVLFAACCATVSAQTPATIVVKEGDTPAGGGGNTVTVLNTAYVAGNGKVGFVGTLSDTSRFIWFDTGITFRSTDALPTVLTGAEGTMGVSNAGGFAYSPSIDGEDGIWSQAGKIVRGTEPAPGDPLLFTSFGSRPRMSADGTAYWIGGTSTTSGGSTTTRVFYKATTTGGPPVITQLIKGGDTQGGVAITALGLGFAYDISDNNAHLMNAVTFTGSTATDAGIVLDNVIVAREGSPTGSGENWTSQRSCGVNNFGNWIVYGDTTAATTQDEVLMYNSSVIAREGNIIGGVTLGTLCDAAAINNNNQIAMIWDTAAGESLFFGDASSILTSSVVLSVGDLLNTDGVPGADYTLTDFNASATVTYPLDLGDDGKIYLDVDLTPIAGGSAIQAIISVPEPSAVAALAVIAPVVIRRRRR